MRLIRILLRVVVGGFAALGLLLVAARMAAPWPIDGRAADRARIAAAVKDIAQLQANREPLYLSIDGRDPTPEQMRAIAQRTSARDLRPFSQRSAAADHCQPRADGPIAMGPCRKDDFLELRLVSMPLWRTAFIVGSTAACGFEQVLVQGPRDWVEVSRRWWCA